MDSPYGKTGDKFLLWIDAVGGYLVCLGDDVTLGQPGGSGRVDVPILGDLSSRHARIRRDGEGYLIEAIREVRVNGRRVDRVMSLGQESRIELGEGVKLSFRRPHALSGTARLDFLSRHRTQPSVEAVLLMADACVLGAKPHSHVVCRDWPNEVVLYRHDDDLYCRSRVAMEIDGVWSKDRSRITPNSRIVGKRFSLSLEAM